jgi:hypothetical protein
MRAGSPAALIASLSGTLTAIVMMTATRYRPNAAAIQGSAGVPRLAMPATRVRTRAPPKAVIMNHGLMMARSI